MIWNRIIGTYRLARLPLFCYFSFFSSESLLEYFNNVNNFSAIYSWSPQELTFFSDALVFNIRNSTHLELLQKRKSKKNVMLKVRVGDILSTRIYSCRKLWVEFPDFFSARFFMSLLGRSTFNPRQSLFMLKVLLRWEIFTSLNLSLLFTMKQLNKKIGLNKVKRQNIEKLCFTYF